VPPRGHVLPDGDRAFRAALVAASVLISISFFALWRAGPSFPGSSQTWQGCLFDGAKLSAPTILAGTFVLRRVALADSWRLGAALGAASGSLAGLTLHFTCGSASPAHVALAHGGGVVLGAILGALSLALLVRLRR